jgi:hypothetical protein
MHKGIRGMSLRKADETRTICEVLREINDIIQDDSSLVKSILPKLIEAETMAKKMAKKLVEYNKEIFSDWWEVNSDYEEDLKRRIEKSYLTDLRRK